MTTPDSWHAYAAAALERERWRVRGVWNPGAPVTREQAERARPFLLTAHASLGEAVMVDGVVWTWRPTR